MFIIGITGGSGAGKTSALKALEKFGSLILDCDALYHELLAENEDMKAELDERYEGVLIDGLIDRKRLGEIVFSDAEALSDLNTITHRYVSADIENRIAAWQERGGTIAAIDAIALIESGRAATCDVTVGVTAPIETRVERIMLRDGISREQAEMRIGAQKPENFFKEHCDYVLENNLSTSDAFEKASEEFFSDLLKKYPSKIHTNKRRINMSYNTAEVRQKIDEFFAKNQEAMLEDLSKLIAINSVKGPAQEGAPCGAAPREVLRVAQEMLEKNGFEVINFEDIMITADLGKNPAELGILAHLDIVDAGEGWDTDPFTMTVKDGKILGRGVIDNKGPAVASMYAMYCAREICPELKNGVRLILGSDEESGFLDVTQYLAKNAPPPNVFSPDAEFPVVNTEKGRFAPFFGASWKQDTALPRIISVTGGTTINIVPYKATAEVEGFEIADAKKFCKEFSEKTGAEITAVQDGGKLVITSIGKAAHASMPELGNNAQTALIEMLAAMPFAQSKSFEYIRALNRLFSHGDYNGKAIGIAMEDEISGKLTVNFGVLRFSELEFAANFDSRTPACADSVDITGITTAAFEKEGIKVTESTISECHHTPADTPFVQTLLKIYEEYTGNESKCITMGGQTYVHDIPGGVVFGCGFPGINYFAHGVNEFMTVEQLIISAKMFTQVILDMCG